MKNKFPLCHLERWVCDEATAVALVEKSQLKVAMVPNWGNGNGNGNDAQLGKWQSCPWLVETEPLLILDQVYLSCVVLETILLWSHLCKVLNSLLKSSNHNHHNEWDDGHLVATLILGHLDLPLPGTQHYLTQLSWCQNNFLGDKMIS